MRIQLSGVLALLAVEAVVVVVEAVVVVVEVVLGPAVVDTHAIWVVLVVVVAVHHLQKARDWLTSASTLDCS